MHLDFPVSSTMINDFILKGMDETTAAIEKTDFVYMYLVAAFERVIDSHQVNTD